MLKSTMVFAMAALAAGGVHAQADLDALMEQHRYALTIHDGRLAGPGAAWLVAEADRVHFFMFGEQHATADIAQLATAMMRSFRPLGYQRAAVEVGPWSTPVMEALLRDGDAFERYLATEGRSLTFPFFFFAEEAEFGRTVIELSDLPSGALWGVDQEFIAGAAPLLDLLSGWTDTEQARAAVEAARTKAAANPMLLGAGTDADWQELIDAFASSRNRQARQLLDEIEVSRRIYRPFVGGGGSVYLANEERERYMKTNFARQLLAAERQGSTPKVFLKFGANHVFDGRSPTDVLSLGNFVRETGVARGLESFNVHVDCLGGSARDPRSGAAAPCSSYFVGAKSGIAGYLLDDGITLIDLRALRPHARLWADFDENSRRLIWSFDAYIAMPNVAAATVVGSER